MVEFGHAEFVVGVNDGDGSTPRGLLSPSHLPYERRTGTMMEASPGNSGVRLLLSLSIGEERSRCCRCCSSPLPLLGGDDGRRRRKS
ncbi:unnamed protein product [Linum trigynum]|uniref:Uncharacterized protein n=1 Tax=Linum trigynum TaxID=586398 RepID=A0AAV2FYI8_9ROSI